MIYKPNDIQIPELCPIQFVEPDEYGYYKMQGEYLPKLDSSGFDLNVLISESAYFSTKDIILVICDSNDNVVYNVVMSKNILSTGYYYANYRLDFDSHVEVDYIAYFRIYLDELGSSQKSLGLYNNYNLTATITSSTSYKGHTVYRTSFTAPSGGLDDFKNIAFGKGVVTSSLFSFQSQVYYYYMIWKPISHIDTEVSLEPSNINSFNDISTIDLYGGWKLSVAESGISNGADSLYAAFKTPSASEGVPVIIDWCTPSLYDSSKTGTLAESLWYILNPTYRTDLKTIYYYNKRNDWDTIFSNNNSQYIYKFLVEIGFIPKDNRDEQEAEDFITQDMINETVYGNEYEVCPATIGDSMGVPNWIRKKISRASLCSTFKINDIEYKRASGSKIEKVEDTENGLAVYKIDLQKTKNYLQ